MNFGSLIGGIGSLFGGFAEAKGYGDAAAFYKDAARMTKLSGAIKDVAIKRQIMGVIGTTKANQLGNGLQISGSALDVIHSNTQQGYLTKAITDLNTQIEYKSYMAQYQQAKAAEQAAQMGGIFGAIGGIVGMFSDDDLKSDIEFLGRRGDGIGIYRFRYNGSPTFYIGVLASEIEALRPEAVVTDGDFRRVDYDKLGIVFREDRAYA